MPNIFVGCTLICLCAVQFLLALEETKIESTKLRVNNLIHNEKIICLKNGITNRKIFTKSLAENSFHSIQKRKANNLVHTLLKNKFPRPGQRSLVLILDATESMSSDLPHIQQGVKKIVNTLSELEDNPIYNYILVPFHEENGAIETTLVTDDKEELLSTLHSIRLHGGDDCPEKTLSALIEGLKHALPHSYVLVFTDASANDFQLEGEVIELIQRKQATILMILTGYCDNKNNEKYKVYERLTQFSNGQVYHIRSDKIEYILNNFSTKSNSHHVLLTAFYVSEADSSRWEFSVDETVNKLDFMVSGEKANVWLYRPNGKMVMNAIETVNLSHVKGYAIENPSTGIWQIDVDAKSSHSVRITADSKLSFSYGFSVQSPSSMLNTHFFPFKGTKNILTIVSSEKVNLSEVHLLPYDLDSSKLIVLPLNEEKITNAAEYLYETDAFDPPKVPFRISVNGYNEKGIQINRTISTTLRKSNGPPPEVFLNATNLNINQGESSLLTCTVRSAVPFTVGLQHGQKVLKELQINESSTDISYKIESAELDDNGQYTCVATSIFGSTNRTVKVKVTWVPAPVVTTNPKIFTVSIPMTEYVGRENQSKIEIPCSVRVDPISSFTRNWYFNDTKIDIDGTVYEVEGDKLIIFNLTKELAGNYTCVVTANNETKLASTKLSVQFAPILLEPDNEEISVKYGESLNVSCSADAVPPIVQSKWKLPDGGFENLLRIESFEATDEGLYECVLDNGIEPAAVRRVTLRAQE